MFLITMHLIESACSSSFLFIYCVILNFLGNFHSFNDVFVLELDLSYYDDLQILGYSFNLRNTYFDETIVKKVQKSNSFNIKYILRPHQLCRILPKFNKHLCMHDSI